MLTSPSTGTQAKRDKAAASLVIQAWAAGMKPEPLLMVSEWADEYRQLPPTAAEPGRWRTARTPYLKEVMDALSPSHPAESVVVMKGAQVGGTEVGLNWLGFTIHHAPGLMLMVQPSLMMAKRNTHTRLDPLIEATPVLRGRVVEKRSKEAGNSVFHKTFPGGELAITGANSAAGLRSTPARYLFLDEVDAYPADAEGEGDPVALAEKRTVTFRGRRKIYAVSTPTRKGWSRIEAAYSESDQRKFYLPCKHCGEYEVITWAAIQWERDEQGNHVPETAAYVCPHCGGRHQEHDKKFLLEHGEWRTTAPGDGRIVGFHLPGLLSPFETWADQVAEFLRVKADPDRFRVWVNTTLGESWEESGEAPEWERLYERRESYPIGRVPAGGLLLTAGVDVQANRLEVEIVAWGRNLESWSIEYRIFPGDTSALAGAPWSALTALLAEEWPHEQGALLPLRMVGVDEGYNTQTVRDWARRQSADRVVVLKGQETGSALVGLPTAVDVNSRGRRITRGVRVWPVATAMAKSQLYGWLRSNRPTDEELTAGAGFPHGWCHFPQYDGEYFKMLTAEQIVTRTVRGYTRREWAKKRERNEALDCRVYARAAAYVAGVDRAPPHYWDRLEEQLTGLRRPAPSESEAAPAAAPEAAPAPRGWSTAGRARRRSGQSSYMRR